MEPEILAKLKRKGGYHDGRIRPYPFDPSLWIAETYIPGRTAKKTLEGAVRGEAGRLPALCERRAGRSGS